MEQQLWSDYGTIGMMAPHILGLIIGLVVLAIIRIIFGLFIKNTMEEGEDRNKILRWTTLGVSGLAALLLVNFLLAFLSMSTNEIPRVGPDRGAVIEGATSE